jgi:hypothetical protein
MARSRFGLALVGALALTLVACSGGSDTKTLDVQRASKEILQVSADVYGSKYDITKVKCPGRVPQEKDLTFFCTVEIEGQPLRIDLKQTNNKGAVQIHQAQAVLVTQKNEDLVTSYLTGKGTPARTVDCGKTVIVIKTPGQVVKCRVTYPDGTKAVATLGVRNTLGTNTPLLSVKPSS